MLTLEEKLQNFPYMPHLFVNREKFIEEVLKEINSDKAKQYFEFIGIPGIGKTKLLEKIYHTCETDLKKFRDSNRKAGTLYYCVYINLEEAEFQGKQLYPLLETIANQLSAQIDNPDCFQPFKEQVAIYEVAIESIPQMNRQDLLPLQAGEVNNAFNENLAFVLRNHTIVICLDSTEKADSDMLALFEQQVLYRLKDSMHFMLIMAGQTSYIWKQSWLKNKTTRYTMNCLDAKAVRSQLSKLAKDSPFEISEKALEQVVDVIFALTQGHPYSNYTLFTECVKQNPLGKVDYQQLRQEGIPKLLQNVIKDRFVKDTDLEEKYPNIVDILEYLAVLRYIPLFMCTHILSEYFKYSSINSLSLLHDLSSTYLFIQSEFKEGHVIDPVARNILLLNLQQKDDALLRTHEYLADKYRATFLEQRKKQHVSKEQNGYLIEWFYHAESCVRYNSGQFDNVKIQQIFQEALEVFKENELADDILYDLEQRLKADPDLKTYSLEQGVFARINDIWQKLNK